jgi:hypothetical protein
MEKNNNSKDSRKPWVKDLRNEGNKTLFGRSGIQIRGLRPSKSNITCFFITCHLYSSVSLDEDDILFNGGDCFFLYCLCFLFVVTEKCELSSQSVEADEEFLHFFPLIV